MSESETKPEHMEHPIEAQPPSHEGEPEARPDEEIFDVSGLTDDEIIRKYRPRFLGRGGEHVVYEIPEHPDVVAKIDVDLLRKALEYRAQNREAGVPADFITESDRAKLDEQLRAKRACYEKMREIFGREHVLPERIFFMKVPITDAIRDAIFHGPTPDAVKTDAASEVWAVVKIQRRAPELNNPERFGIVGGYLEQRDPHPEVYRRVTAATIEHEEGAHFTTDEFRELMGSPIEELLEKAETDAAIRTALIDFVRRAIQYTNETGELLDLAGFDNVPFWREPDGTWNYRLVDALYPGYGNSAKLELAPGALIRAAAGEQLDNDTRVGLLNAVNYVRLVNGLAAYLGEGERIDLVPPEARGKIDYLKVFGKE